VLHGLSWLERFTTTSDVVSGFKAGDRAALGLPPVGPLYVGFLCWTMGNAHKEKRLSPTTRRTSPSTRTTAPIWLNFCHSKGCVIS
jgi:hypothetical protein